MPIHESTVQVLGDFPSFSQEVVRLERSQGRTPISEALEAGPAHRALIEALPDAWRADPEVQIFSRMLYLQAGWHPLTPHYHFDWGGQEAPDGSPVQTLCVLLGDSSLTEFILGPLDHPERPPEEERPPEAQDGRRRRHRGGMGGMGMGGGRGRWDAQVEAGLKAGTLRRYRAEPDKLILFDNRSLHRARPATKAGWRVLIRAIRGLSRQEVVDHGQTVPALRGDGYAPGRFHTCRNGFLPTTDEERARYQPYSDRGPA